jgi:poly(hydroxyalkanoate) depolymerase family esterase
MKSYLAMIFFACLFTSAANAAQGKWINDSFSNTDGSREFLFYVPSGYQAQEKRPLLLALHGCMNPADQFAGLAGLEKLAEDNRLLLVLPKQDLFANVNLCWNWHFATNQVRGSGEPSIIMGTVEWAKKHYAVDTAKIYVAGVSAGGSMASVLLSTYPDVFAAGLVGSGTMFGSADGILAGSQVTFSGSERKPVAAARLAWKNLKDQVSLPKSVPVLVFHGDQDEVCNPINSKQTVEMFLRFNDLLDDGLENQSVSDTPIAQSKGQVENGYSYKWTDYGTNKSKPLVSYYLVHGMGHGWSGGDGQYFYNFASGPSETQIMWNFFQHSAR